MPSYTVDCECRSCGHEEMVHVIADDRELDTSDVNGETAPECSGCGDVDWVIVGEVQDAAASS